MHGSPAGDLPPVPAWRCAGVRGQVRTGCPGAVGGLCGPWEKGQFLSPAEDQRLRCSHSEQFALHFELPGPAPPPALHIPTLSSGYRTVSDVAVTKATAARRRAGAGWRGLRRGRRSDSLAGCREASVVLSGPGPTAAASSSDTGKRLPPRALRQSLNLKFKSAGGPRRRA